MLAAGLMQAPLTRLLLDNSSNPQGYFATFGADDALCLVLLAGITEQTSLMSCLNIQCMSARTAL